MAGSRNRAFSWRSGSGITGGGRDTTQKPGQRAVGSGAPGSAGVGESLREEPG